MSLNKEMSEVKEIMGESLLQINDVLSSLHKRIEALESSIDIKNAYIKSLEKELKDIRTRRHFDDFELSPNGKIFGPG